MKRVVAAVAYGAILTAVYPTHTTAQGQQAAPAASTAAPAAAPAPAKSKPASHAKRGSSTRADARVCLDFLTNPEVIRCAEKYRHMRAPT